MMATATQEERFAGILHKQHGWLDAPSGCSFVERGKMVYLVTDESDEERRRRRALDEPLPLYRYPYGTAWRLTSVLAFTSTR